MKNIVTLLLAACCSAPLAAQTDIVDSPPEGIVKTYDLSTCQVYKNSSYDYSGIKTDIVVADDNSRMWLKDIVTAFGFGTLVCGDVKGDTLYIKSGQHIQHQPPIDNFQELDIYLQAGVWEGDYFRPTDDEYIKLAIADDGTMESLENSGMAAVDQYGGVLGSNHGYLFRPFDMEKETVAPPADIPDMPYCLNYKDDFGNEIYRLVNVRVDDGGNSMYIQGLAERYAPQSWIKGVVEGDAVSFAKRQYLGLAEGQFLDFFYPGRKAGSFSGGYELADNLVFTIDRQTGRMVADGAALEMLGDKIFIGGCDNPSLAPYTPHSAVPAAPVMLGYSDYRETAGFIVLRFNISPVDTDGEYIDPDGIEWRLIVDGKPYTFSKSKYMFIDEDTEVFKWGYTDGVDIVFEACGLYNIWLYDDCSEVMVECSYTYGGVTKTATSSPMRIEGGATGIGNTSDGQQPETVSVRYYDMQGRAVQSPAHGLYIRTETKADGSRSAEKVFVR